MFTIIKKDPRTKARVGIIETPHGIIETPAYAIVGTHGQIKCLPNQKIPETKTQLVMTNTYHLWQDFKGSKGELDNLPAVQNFFGQNMPTITDSGGFQVFSHGFGREHGVGKLSSFFPKDEHCTGRSGNSFCELAEQKLCSPEPRKVYPEKNLVRITEEGAFFQEQFLGPELSIKIQEKLGADLILSFDECTSPYHNYDYTKKAMARTHRWAKVCLQTKTRNNQLLYGIVQGGEFRDLREESAKFINPLPFDGIAVGGSLGKSKSGMFDVLRWTIPFLDESRPRHFLGIGKIEDIFESVELGIDTFDCVVPTREARHGGIYTKQGRIDITKTIYKDDQSKLEADCLCPACLISTKAELHSQFRSKNQQAGENATIHNVYFFNHLMAEIREAIKNDKLPELKKKYTKTKAL